jgi:DNA (cytosine-5)-methyltransferase 1
MEELKNIGVIDLFCGVGGLSHGFVLENFEVIAGIDNDSKCKYAFETNNKSKFICKDIQLLKGEELSGLYGNKLKILVGCAPCQPFSSYSFKQKEKDKNKWELLYSFARLIEETQPTIISMENVSQLLHFRNPPVLEHFCDVLSSLRYYSVEPSEVYCPDYGIPQRRKRLVLLASRLGAIKLIDKTHTPENYVTVRQTIAKLPPVGAGETDKSDLLHRARVLTPLNLSRIKATTEGGGWKDWHENLQLDCHKKKSGKSYGSVYGRMRWDDVAPTMTTHCTGLGNGRFGHPEQDRAITLREASLFQTFPENYTFFDNKENYNMAMISRHIGNAVPPLLGRVIAKSIKIHLKQHNII